jgi:hypothetical protein
MHAQTLIFAVLLLFGLALLTYAMFCLSRALASRSWPTARGTVTRSFVEEDNDEGVTYTARVTYRYSVGGREFSSNQVQAGGLLSWGWVRCAERVTDRYPIGASVRVRYLPSNPKIALLEPGFNFSIGFYFAAGIAFLAWARDMSSAL